MTQEEKYLLFKTLLDGVPYGIVCNVQDKYINKDYVLTGIHTNGFNFNDSNTFYGINSFIIKPYLRDMEDMTEQEKKEYYTLGNHCICTSLGFVHLKVQELIDWLNKNHFNWRGLPENLYIKITKENNPY